MLSILNGVVPGLPPEEEIRVKRIYVARNEAGHKSVFLDFSTERGEYFHLPFEEESGLIQEILGRGSMDQLVQIYALVAEAVRRA